MNAGDIGALPKYEQILSAARSEKIGIWIQLADVISKFDIDGDLLFHFRRGRFHDIFVNRNR
jgi:hypothetical protein